MQVRCKQVRKVDHVSSQLKDYSMNSEAMRSSSSSICYSIEIKDAYIPPWIISGVCDAMCSKGGDFQARYLNFSSSLKLELHFHLMNESL